MKIVVFGPQRRVGGLLGDRVVDLNLADPALPASLERFIEGGDAALERAARAVESAEASGAPLAPAASIGLRAPVVSRPRIACAGGNYAVHLAGAMAANSGADVSPEDVYREMRGHAVGVLEDRRRGRTRGGRGLPRPGDAVRLRGRARGRHRPRGSRHPGGARA